MKRKLCVVYVMLSLIIFSGCSKKELNYTVKEADGIKTYHNKNIPSDPTFKISPKEIFTIHGFDENATDTLRNFTFLRSTVVDSKGNIFILDQKKAEIKKFDKNGTFIKSFCKLGSGPGELQGGSALICLNDTLGVKDASISKFSKFTTDGDFIESFVVDGYNSPQFVTPVGTKYFLNDHQEYSVSDKEEILSFDLQIRDTKYSLIKSLKKDQGQYIGANTIIHDYVHPFCVGKKNIYLAKISDNEYSIDVFDFTGTLLYKTKKDYRKIVITKDELKEFGDAQNLTHDVSENYEYKVNYKKAVNAMGMFEDKNGYLLVQIPQDRNEKNKYDFIVDAFKDGVFINTFKIDIGRGFDFYNSSHQRFFIRNRIYYQNREDNCVTVYEY